MGTKIIRRIKKSKKWADYFIIPPMTTERGSQPFRMKRHIVFTFSTFQLSIIRILEVAENSTQIP